MSGRLQRRLHVLLQVQDSPHRIALAFGLGVWIACSPMLGLHTLLAIGIALAFDLSRATILIGAYVNNPWTIAPIYMAGTTLGCYVLGVSGDGLAAIDWDLHGRAFYSALFAGLRPYVWPFIVGNTALGTVCGAVAYVALRLILQRRAVEQRHDAP